MEFIAWNKVLKSNNMVLILIALAILLMSGLCALVINRFAQAAVLIGSWGVIAASLVGLVPVLHNLINGSHVSFLFPWTVPCGSFLVAIDSLSALFLFPIFVLSAIASLYGMEYLVPFFGKKPIGLLCFFFNLLIVSMVVLVIARNVVLFLLAWELMSVSSFFLVMFEGEREDARKAGLTYLIAAHVGTAFLLVMFILLKSQGQSFDFTQFSAGEGILPSIIFLLAIIGFGTKAGFIPLHIWLPQAHPAAPSHVSAVMSGVMIKTGIYGLIRVLTFLGTPCAWWGYLLIIIGIISGVLGVLFALAQHDLKRLLAYHSIENIGIIAIGLGFGVLGISINNISLIVLGFTGALLHVVNHAFFKGLLFLGAGTILHAAGTREIDVLGGLLKKMPITGVCFLIGSAAICGLPPLNGFISEFLIYFAAFKSIFGSTTVFLIALTVIASLALIGGLAAACFTKVFGIIFLGEYRSTPSQPIHEGGLAMKIAMVSLSVICVLIGAAAPVILSVFKHVLVDVTGMPAFVLEENMLSAKMPLVYIVCVSFCLFAGVCLVFLLRRNLLRRRKVEKSVTWDCGYARPICRMQYTASSFVQPLTDFFHTVLRSKREYPRIEEYFPRKASFETHTPDIFQCGFYQPLFENIYHLILRLRWFQHGRLQIYILYILVSLLLLIFWKLR